MDEYTNLPIDEHFITIETRWLKSAQEFTVRHKARGWRMQLFQGRHSMERFICLPCLIGQDEMQREHKRKIDQELKSQLVGDSYYLAVCGE